MKAMMKGASVVAIAVLMVSGAFAQGKKPAAKPKTTKAAVCSVCKMPLAAKASKMNPVAVKYEGKVMYCCSKCKMPPGMLAKTAAKKPMAKKPMQKKGK